MGAHGLWRLDHSAPPPAGPTVQIAKQLGTMFRAHILNQTAAKVSLAVHHYSDSRYASALSAISNEQRRFANLCCQRPVSALEATTWGMRQGDLNVRLQGVVLREVITRADLDNLGPDRMKSFCSQLHEVRGLMADRGQAGNRNTLTQLIGDGGFSATPVEHANDAPAARSLDAETDPGTFARSLTFEGQCKLFSDSLWSRGTPTWDAFNERLQQVVTSADAGAADRSARATCLRTFEVIAFIRGRAPVQLASDPALAARWESWSTRAETEAVARLLQRDTDPRPTLPQPRTTLPTATSATRRVHSSSLPGAPRTDAEPRVSFLYPARSSYSVTL